MKGSDLIVKILESNGIKYVFGVPGDIETDIAESLKASSINFVTARNEKSAAFMADIYSRTTKHIGVCFSTVGPGATNLISGLANATADRSSVIAISDQLPREEMNLKAHQFIDYRRIFDPLTGVTKWNTTLSSSKEIISEMRRAFKEAYSEFKGAVHVGVPVDILSEKADSNLADLRFDLEESTLGLNKRDIEPVYERIKNSKSIILVGGSVKRACSQNQFKEFVNKTKFPVLSTFTGKGSIDEREPLYLGTISRHLHDIFEETFKKMDTIICVGYDFMEGIKPSIFGDLEKVVNIDVADNRVLGKYEPKINLFGNLSEILSELVKREYKQELTQDYESIKSNVKKAIYGSLDMRVYPPRPHKIMEAINNIYGENSIIICDVGMNKYYSGLLLRTNPDNEAIFSNGMSAMAFTSGALAAKLARPEKNVLAIVGDGGFLMDPQEISTCIRYNLPLTTIVLNNSGLGLVEKKQRKNFGSTYEVKFGNPDYVKFAEAFGAKGYSIRSWGQLEEVLNETKSNNKINIIDVPVDYNEGI